MTCFEGSIGNAPEVAAVSSALDLDERAEESLRRRNAKPDLFSVGAGQVSLSVPTAGATHQPVTHAQTPHVSDNQSHADSAAMCT